MHCWICFEGIDFIELHILSIHHYYQQYCAGFESTNVTRPEGTNSLSLCGGTSWIAVFNSEMILV